MNTVIDLSICIVNWNGLEFITQCLDSIRAYSETLQIEVIVVDNHSSDNSVAILERDYPEVRLIKNRDNRGFGRASNQAIHDSRGPYILLLNPDIRLMEPCLTDMIRLIEETEDAGCVSCRLVNPDGRLQENFFYSFPNAWNEFFSEGLFLNKIVRNHKDSQPTIPVTRLHWATGACLLFKSGLLKKLEGFDEQFFMYSEDVDLCYRVHAAGYHVYGLNTHKMYHHLGATSAKNDNKHFSVIMQKESRMRFIRKHFGTVHAAIYRSLWLVAGVLRAFIALVLYPFALFKGKQKTVTVSRIWHKHVNIISWALFQEKWMYPLYEQESR